MVKFQQLNVTVILTGQIEPQLLAAKSDQLVVYVIVTSNECSNFCEQNFKVKSDKQYFKKYINLENVLGSGFYQNPLMQE